MRLWARDGTVLYADADRLIGRQFKMTPNLQQALAGNIVANYDHFNLLDEGSEEANASDPYLYAPQHC